MRSHTHEPKEYMAIRLWGKNLGSYDSYILNQQESASRDDAPIDAIYRSHEGKWKAVSDLAIEHPFRTQYTYELAKAKEKST